MGPPVFAPLLFGVSAYLGLLASFLRRGEAAGSGILPLPAHPNHWAKFATGEHEPISWTQDVREGRFQKQMAIATAVSAFFSGFEAWYSHYKNNFRYKAQWTPVIIAPMLMAAGIAAVKSPRIARTWLPAISAVAIVDGAVGFGSRAWCFAAAGRLEKAVLQRHLRPAAVCALIVCGLRISRRVG